ncbi:MAG: peptidase U32 family protein [Desulfobacterales bacterium]
MSKETTPPVSPAILAPAGNKSSFLAALAAGADAIYCGLKRLSARMAAENFSIDDLTALTQLAHEEGTEVYVALNSLLKPEDLLRAGRLLYELEQRVHPDALIIQDLSMVQLVRQTGFSGELHLSTLANVSFPGALKHVKDTLGIDRVVIPRELNIDEIKTMAGACPEDFGIEVFVHGALCYGVSGRCYWSSYMGGRSGLRGRCVQPCRRAYRQLAAPERTFSCQDLSLDVLTKTLLAVPEIKAWKIEGRKKGPHYVYHTVKAYKTLREGGREPGNWATAKKEALDLLSRSLGRTGTHFNFLPQRPQLPIVTRGQTGSGMLMGRMKGSKHRPFIQPRESLMSGDVLRVGYEDEPWHTLYTVKKFIPKKGHMTLIRSSGKRFAPGAPVFLIDRREKTLQEMISERERKLDGIPVTPAGDSFPAIALPHRSGKRKMMVTQNVYRLPVKKAEHPIGVWLSRDACRQVGKAGGDRIWWWLPPVMWPEDTGKHQKLVQKALKNNGRNFVLNAPWQIGLFRNVKGLNIWAGPFCNAANGLAIQMLETMGFKGVVVSPELGQSDFLDLPGQSPLPLGIVISGNWPLCVSRVLSEEIQTETLFTSPKGEQAWVREYESDFWVYPNWKIDLTTYQGVFQKAGYCLFVHLFEPIPKGIEMKKRPGLWNWDVDLL